MHYCVLLELLLPTLQKDVRIVDSDHIVAAKYVLIAPYVDVQNSWKGNLKGCQIIAKSPVIAENVQIWSKLSVNCKLWNLDCTTPGS